MSLITELPSLFSQFSEARQKGFLTVMELKERGVPLVGTYCTFMPQEIPMAAGAVVVSLCSTSDETIEEAEKDLPRNLCPLIKSSYGFGKTDKCPYFYFSDLVVGETTCDGKKKMYEYMAEFKPVHVMQLPNSTTDDASRALWKAEMQRLKEAVEARFGATIDETALREAIALRNRERKALADFYHLGQLNPPALSGTDLLKVVYGATFRFDKEALIAELEAMTATVKAGWLTGQRLDPRPRILITGCPIGGAAEKVVRAIEENGGWVVGYENCTGAKATERNVAETGDVWEALADKYLAIGCSCVSPNTQRLKLLSEMVEEYQADGVIDVILQACHTYAVESLAIKRHVRQQHDIPYMAIETDYSTSDIGQLSTRVAAFIEMFQE
ncbi:double-cubane-cluster-containing anaerobic reductase [Yokenella regensburgei]|uniref:double-cubane-cluster-containing anaerobic reductase n=1 Tax=Yokenella regensburgei TaxID=158877 RepID=UPI001375B2D1|nr:double-cubane-cluster-containing anaerobic reductase [Yokenella regensburgei]KAF1370778.1 benzoyl-CoA reductase/2-hydroxyglutaryl-CoA dehydratase subunit BcrC/BadD/HgdB [Yokenella regensburgei]